MRGKTMDKSTVESMAAALYDGGWRAADKEELIAEYDLSADEAEAVCNELERYEEEEA